MQLYILLFIHLSVHLFICILLFTLETIA
jgi:hypothetical protein